MNLIVGIVDNKQTNNISVHHVGLRQAKLILLSYNYSVLLITMFTHQSLSTHIPYKYPFAFEFIKLCTLQVRRHKIDVLFFTYAFVGSKVCISLVDNISLRSSIS